jgi:hypothetical protein
MGPECAGANGGHRRRYRTRVRSQGSSYYAATDEGTAGAPTLFTLVDGDEDTAERPVAEEVAAGGSGFARILMQFPTDLVDLVLSASAANAITWRVKSYSKKKKPHGSISPGRTLQEIRRMCIDLRLTFWPGILDEGLQIACVPYGEEDWKFENSERVMSRQELEAYLARYRMIRPASK